MDRMEFNCQVFLWTSWPSWAGGGPVSKSLVSHSLSAFRVILGWVPICAVVRVNDNFIVLPYWETIRGHHFRFLIRWHYVLRWSVGRMKTCELPQSPLTRRHGQNGVKLPRMVRYFCELHGRAGPDEARSVSHVSDIAYQSLQIPRNRH